MKSLKNLFGRLVREEQGTEVMEWALVAGLIVVGAIVAIIAVGGKVSEKWGDLNTAFTD